MGRSVRLTTDTVKATGKSIDLRLKSIRGQGNKEKHTETLLFFTFIHFLKLTNQGPRLVSLENISRQIQRVMSVTQKRYSKQSFVIISHYF